MWLLLLLLLLLVVLAAEKLHVIYIKVVIPGKTGKYTPCQFCNSHSATLAASHSVIVIQVGSVTWH